MRTNLKYGSAALTDVAVGTHKLNTLREVPHDQEKEHFSKDCQTSGKPLQGVCCGTEWRTLCTLLICHLQLWGSQLMPEESVVFSITEPHTGYSLITLQLGIKADEY